MDITSIAYEESSFSGIYCSHVLEHIPDDRRAIAELYRVLEHGGWAILLVPITADKTIEDPTVVDPEERLRLYGQEDHVRRYGPDYVERLREPGFEVEVLRSTNIVDQAMLDHYGVRLNAGEIFFCRKPDENLVGERT